MKKTLIIFAVCTLFIAVPVHADDVQEIRNLIGKTFDQPDAKVLSEPIVIEGEYAVADWMQGEKGGRALLHKKHNKWSIVLCAGDSIKAAAALVRAGIPEKTASNLESKLVVAESKLTPVQVERFGRFKDEGKHRARHLQHH